MAKSTGRTRPRSAGEGSVYLNGERWRGAVTWTEPGLPLSAYELERVTRRYPG